MNKEILSEKVQNYIKQNIKIDPLTLIFKKSPFENITMKEIVEQIDGLKRAKKNYLIGQAKKVYIILLKSR